MYEVTIMINGIPKKVSVHSSDAQAVTEIVTNMFQGQIYEIIDIRRIKWKTKLKNELKINII